MLGKPPVKNPSASWQAIGLSPPQARQELNPSHVSAYLRIKKRTTRSRQYLYFRRFLQGICRADNQNHIITYIKEARDSPKEFGAQCRKGKCLVRSSLDHNLERGGDEPELKGWINQRPTCLKDSPRKDLVPMRICAKPWTTRSCLKETKSFDLERTGHNSITLTISLGRSWIPKTLTHCYFIPKKL